VKSAITRGKRKQPERLNKKNSKECAIVRTLRKLREVAEMSTRLFIGLKSNRVCELRQTCGFRFGFASRITNDSWIINLRATLA